MSGNVLGRDQADGSILYLSGSVSHSALQSAIYAPAELTHNASESVHQHVTRNAYDTRNWILLFLFLKGPRIMFISVFVALFYNRLTGKFSIQGFPG